METEKDRLLWKEAKKRVGFRNHLFTYLLMNVFFWVLWYFTDGKSDHHGLPWPALCTLGWGFGLFWHFMGTHVMGNKASQVEKEYEKLKNKQN